MTEPTLEQEYNEIWGYYNEALTYIQEGNMEKAVKVLYNNMPANLYDTSLDILYNRNTEFSNSKLKALITEVDNFLVAESTEEDSEISDEYEFF